MLDGATPVLGKPPDEFGGGVAEVLLPVFELVAFVFVFVTPDGTVVELEMGVTTEVELFELVATVGVGEPSDWTRKLPAERT